MKTVDTSRRNTLKGMATLSALATFGSILHAGTQAKTQTVVLVNSSAYTKAFLSGVDKVTDTAYYVENVNIIEEYAEFEAVLDAHLQNKDVTTFTGLLTQGDYALFIAALKTKGLKLKAEITHDVTSVGTTHHIEVSHTASAVLNNASKALTKDNEWAFLVGYVLGGGCSDSVLASRGKNGFQEKIIQDTQKGDATLVSFLATIKESKHV